MEHLKNIGMGAAAISVVVLVMALGAASLVITLETLNVLERRWPGTGPAVAATVIAIAALWAIGRTVRR